jgi:cyclopropane fatty-acyl-phospholipid synthase-like methyltransferase
MTNHELQSSEFYRVRYSGALRQLQDAVFSEVYDDYFGQSSWITTADYDRFFSMLEVARASSVLDVASGWGAPALRLARRTGCSVVGIEINHEAVASATALAEQLDLAARVRFELCDACQPLSFPDGAFDAICCFDALGHFLDRDRLFAEWSRLLKPGGATALHRTDRYGSDIERGDRAALAVICLCDLSAGPERAPPRGKKILNLLIAKT